MRTIKIKLYYKLLNACMFTAIILCVAGASGYTVEAMIGPTDNFAQNSMDSFDMTSMYDMGDYSMDQFYNNADDLYTVDALNDMNDVLFFGVDNNIHISDVDPIGEASIYLPEYETAEPAITDDGMWSSGMNDFFCETDIMDNSLTTLDPVDISMLPEDANIDLVFIEPTEMATDIVFDPGIQDISAMNEQMDMGINNMFDGGFQEAAILDTLEAANEDDGDVYFSLSDTLIYADPVEDNSIIEGAPLMDDSMYIDMMVADQEMSASLDYSMMESIMMEQNALASQEALEEAYQQAMEEAMLEAMEQEMAEQEQQGEYEDEEKPYTEKTSEDYEAEFEYYLSLYE